MSKSRRPERRRYLLDFGRLEEIPTSKVLHQQFLKYHWEYYCAVAFQRAQIQDLLWQSLREQASSFQFPRWQRAVQYQYALDPLSARGSLTDPGGRFNIGGIDPPRYMAFPGLYLASDKDTAIDELLSRGKRKELLSPEELALARSGSIAVVSVSGKLESVIDLREKHVLKTFVDLVKDFQVPSTFIQEAKRLNIQQPRLIRTVNELMHILMEPNWRFMPMQCEAPAPSQIFGQIVMESGVEGIVYKSVLSMAPCLAIFPQNFINSAAYVELDDPVPEETFQKRIDASTFPKFI